MDLAVVSGVNLHRPSTSPDPAANASNFFIPQIDYGILVDLPLVSSYRFETGVIRHSRVRAYSDLGTSTGIQNRGWLIPLTLRFMRTDFLGFGFGPYVALLESKTRTVVVANDQTVSDITADNPNQSGLDIGIKLNLNLRIAVSEKAKIIFDSSYLVGFTDLNTSPIAVDKNQELLFLVGYQFSLFEESVQAEKKDE